jgi:ketosteroid isomerase-like protein
MTALKTLRAYERAAAAHDLYGMLSFIDDSAVYFFSNETAFFGKPAVQDAITANFEAIKIEVFEISEVECVLETSESAAFVFSYHWSGEISGSARSGSGRGTLVMRRAGDSWTIVHEHLSRGPFRSLLPE